MSEHKTRTKRHQGRVETGNVAAELLVKSATSLLNKADGPEDFLTTSSLDSTGRILGVKLEQRGNSLYRGKRRVGKIHPGLEGRGLA